MVLQPRHRPLVMGILNLTPDSFHDASRRTDPQAAVEAALTLVAEGADILDLGAESSRPGSDPVGGDRERERLLPVLEAVRRESAVPISVDTLRTGTAAAALDAGADAVNDISAGRHDPGMLPLVAERGCGLILMHMQGTPLTMQADPHYRNVVAEVTSFLAARAAAAVAAGIRPSCLAVDPGIGFGKNLGHNLALLGSLRMIAGDLPLLLGASRKRFIGEISGAGVPDRLPGSLAALAVAFEAGASIVRVHDVGASVQFLEVLARILEPSASPI